MFDDVFPKILLAFFIFSPLAQNIIFKCLIILNFSSLHADVEFFSYLLELLDI